MPDVPLTRRMVAMVDEEDFPLVVAAGQWNPKRSGNTFYARRTGEGQKQVVMHTLITGWDYVDHVNGNGLDNRRSNLRQATHAQNMANKSRYRNNTSGFKGVSPFRGGGKPWMSNITANGKRHYLGLYDSPVEAAQAYDRAALELFGEFARTNFQER